MAKVDKILVSLDVLLDTRIGTLVSMDSDIANKIIMSDTYHSRDEDIFEGIDPIEFKKAYSNRDVVTLSNSLVTNIIPLLKHLVEITLKESVNDPYNNGIIIIVNYYPYKLSKEDQNEIGKAVTVLMEGIAPVSLVNYSPEQLSPHHCKSNYKIMVMYDYEEWINANAPVFASTQMTEVTMFVPAIYFNNKPDTAELEKMIKDTNHPFAAIELLLSPVVALQLIDVNYFSIINNV